MKKILAVLLSFFAIFSANAFANTITIDVNNLQNASPFAQGMSIQYSALERSQAAAQVITTYRRDVAPVPLDSVVKIIWTDGSSEKFRVKSFTGGSNDVESVPGTQSMPAGGGRGYTTNSSGGFLGGSNVIGFTPIYSTVTVCVGGICDSATYITGYQWIYAPDPKFATVEQ